jgi:hypothetical protein
MCDIPRGLPLDRLSLRYVKLSLLVPKQPDIRGSEKTNNNRKQP